MLRHPPHRGMWIEISVKTSVIIVIFVIPRIGGCGLKLPLSSVTTCSFLVIPRIGGMWIEIVLARIRGVPVLVIPRIGGCGLK